MMSTQSALLQAMLEKPYPTSRFQEVLVMSNWGAGEVVKPVSFNLFNGIY